jgi:hypothetical protein
VCGSTVYWYAEFAPDEIGVAAGNFADPSFPAPTRRALALSKTPLAPPDFTQQIFPRPISPGPLR